jgi:hypothetical protein
MRICTPYSAEARCFVKRTPPATVTLCEMPGCTYPSLGQILDHELCDQHHWLLYEAQFFPSENRLRPRVEEKRSPRLAR